MVQRKIVRIFRSRLATFLIAAVTVVLFPIVQGADSVYVMVTAPNAARNAPFCDSVEEIPTDDEVTLLLSGNCFALRFTNTTTDALKNAIGGTGNSGYANCVTALVTVSDRIGEFMLNSSYVAGMCRGKTNTQRVISITAN
jgi:hypothetical protein